MESAGHPELTVSTSWEQSSNKTNLYFFVTPTILDEDDFQDLWHLSLNKKLEAQNYIGERRLRIIDKGWTGTAGEQARRLEDEGATVEDLASGAGDQSFTGIGVNANVVGPWKTVLSLGYGRALASIALQTGLPTR